MKQRLVKFVYNDTLVEGNILLLILVAFLYNNIISGQVEPPPLGPLAVSVRIPIFKTANADLHTWFQSVKVDQPLALSPSLQ